jgi:hypothetical protein
LSTAVERAFFDLGTQSIVDFNYAIAALNEQLNIGPAQVAQMSDPGLDVPYWGSALMDWNDAPGRTQEEVVQVLQDAAEAAREKAAAN